MSKDKPQNHVALENYRYSADPMGDYIVCVEAEATNQEPQINTILSEIFEAVPQERDYVAFELDLNFHTSPAGLADSLATLFPCENNFIRDEVDYIASEFNLDELDPKNPDNEELISQVTTLKNTLLAIFEKHNLVRLSITPVCYVSGPSKTKEWLRHALGATWFEWKANNPKTSNPKGDA